MFYFDFPCVLGFSLALERVWPLLCVFVRFSVTCSFSYKEYILNSSSSYSISKLHYGKTEDEKNVTARCVLKLDCKMCPRNNFYPTNVYQLTYLFFIKCVFSKHGNILITNILFTLCSIVLQSLFLPCRFFLSFTLLCCITPKVIY